jgi:hypothetical protein
MKVIKFKIPDLAVWTLPKAQTIFKPKPIKCKPKIKK